MSRSYSDGKKYSRGSLMRKRQRREIRARNRTRFARGYYEPVVRLGIYWN